MVFKMKNNYLDTIELTENDLDEIIREAKWASKFEAKLDDIEDELNEIEKELKVLGLL